MRIRGKSIPLQPNLRFGRETVKGRCRNALRQLLTLLYQADVTAESVSEFQWRIDGDRGLVRLVPLAAEDANESDLWTKQPSFDFAVDDFVPQLKKLKGPKNAASRAKLQRQLRDWIADAAFEAFFSKDVEVEYSWFNQDDHPFSITVALTANKQAGSAVVVWSNVRKFKRRDQKKPARQTAPAKKPDYTAAGWQRFYFDDGQTRRFWYIRRQAAVQRCFTFDSLSVTMSLLKSQSAKRSDWRSA